MNVCLECQEDVEGGTYHPTCCPHENIDHEDIADGVVGNGAAHVWAHTCTDCKAEVVEEYGEWTLADPPDPPGAGRDPWGRPAPHTHPEYWTE